MSGYFQSSTSNKMKHFDSSGNATDGSGEYNSLANESARQQEAIMRSQQEEWEAQRCRQRKPPPHSGNTGDCVWDNAEVLICLFPGALGAIIAGVAAALLGSAWDLESVGGIALIAAIIAAIVNVAAFFKDLDNKKKYELPFAFFYVIPVVIAALIVVIGKLGSGS